MYYISVDRILQHAIVIWIRLLS